MRIFFVSRGLLGTWYTWYTYYYTFAEASPAIRIFAAQQKYFHRVSTCACIRLIVQYTIFVQNTIISNCSSPVHPHLTGILEEKNENRYLYSKVLYRI